MALVFEARKGQRIKSRAFIGVTQMAPRVVPYCPRLPLWWDDTARRWLDHIPQDHKGLSSHFYGVRSVRAFRRRLREWSAYVPSGTWFCLVSGYHDHCVYGRITKRKGDRKSRLDD